MLCMNTKSNFVPVLIIFIVNVTLIKKKSERHLG